MIWIVRPGFYLLGGLGLDIVGGGELVFNLYVNGGIV